MKFVPTGEQLNARHNVLDGEHTVMSAYAGASKTTTCIFVSKSLDTEKGMYLAFNRDIATEAKGKFPRHVECRTTHSLAFQAVGKHYVNAGRRIPGRDVRRLRIDEVCYILGLQDGYKGDNAKFTKQGLAYLVKETVTRFCYSADTEVGWRHFPYVNGMEKWSETEKQEVRSLVIHFAGIYWANTMRKNGDVDYEHDHYLKQFQLSEPVIEKDFIMIDEGQDTNPAVFDIFRRQGGHAQLIMVGDSYQSIYQWRGAIDAMAAFEEAVNHVHLTKSFRFGEAVANEANKWLKMLGAVKPLVGFEEIESEVCELDLPRAILCRTNAQVIAETLAAQEHDKKVYVQGGTYEIEQFAKGARDLMQGQPSNHPELIGFKSWDDVVAYVNADKSAKDLRTYVKVIDDYGVEKVLTITERCVDRETYADVTTSTAHKSKGKEWESVRIASDFSEPEDDMETGQPARLTESEMRLAYVAVTRAQRQLDCTALEWVDRWVARYAAGEPITKSHDKLTEQEAAQEAATA